MPTRIEEDLLGQREIPSDAYWGIHTLRAIENYKISGRTINELPQFIRGMVQVKKAAALANKEVHVLQPQKADAIVKACDAILTEGKCMDQFPIDQFQGGAGTSLNMNTNEVVANLALEMMGEDKGRYDIINPNDHVNLGQSTNDAYPTGMRLAMYISGQEVRRALKDICASLDAKGDEFKDMLKMGRTQLQDAVPMTLGQEFHGWAENLAEEDDRLKANFELLLATNMGGTAIGTGLNAAPGYREAVVKHLGEIVGSGIVSASDPVEATPDTGAYVAAHATLKRTAVKLSKICNDLRLLSSGPRAGLNEINLPQMAAGSSIMPAKVNPVIPEVTNQVCFKVIGNDVTLTFASEAGQLELNVMEPVIAQPMFESIRLLVNALDTLRERCIDGITANPEVGKRDVENSIGIVTYFNEIIGHHNGDLVGKRCAETGKTVREVILEMGLLPEEEIDRVLSVENLMNPKFMGTYYDDEGNVVEKPDTQPTA